MQRVRFELNRDASPFVQLSLSQTPLPPHLAQLQSLSCLRQNDYHNYCLYQAF